MNIIGHGVDILDLTAFQKLIDDDEADFIDRCFTEFEKTQFAGSPDELEHLAGRFAAKEAVAKALGTGFDGEVSPRDIEIRNLVSGAPTVSLTGGAATVAARRGVQTWLVSIAHMRPTAMASAIAVGGLSDRDPVR